MNLRVVKHFADEEKDEYKVILKGSSDLVEACLIDVEVKLTGKAEELLDKFPRNCLFHFDLEAGSE